MPPLDALDSKSIGEAVEQFLTANPVSAGLAVGVLPEVSVVAEESPEAGLQSFWKFARRAVGF